MAQTVLVVEDEKPIAEILQYNLQKEGYDVVLAFDGSEAVKTFKGRAVDLVILDIMLPVLDGFEVCRIMRQESYVPILILTAKGQEDDIIHGLELGADDYVTKPFSPREIIARARAILRRTERQNAPAPKEILQIGEISIDLARFQVCKNDQPVPLSLREFELLKFFATNPTKVFTREQLLSEVWGYEYFGETRTVDVTVRRLREKIEDDPGEPKRILTKRGVGYFFHVD